MKTYFTLKDNKMPGKNLNLTVKFDEIGNDGFQIKDSHVINTTNFKAVILHISNFQDYGLTVHVSGNKNFTISTSFELKLKKNEIIRVFYWNDDKEFEYETQKMFEHILIEYGIDNKHPLGEINLKFIEGIAKPKESGNGGVTGVTVP